MTICRAMLKFGGKLCRILENISVELVGQLINSIIIFKSKLHRKIIMLRIYINEYII